MQCTKCFKTLLLIISLSIGYSTAAQVYKDTVFTFYFDTNKHTADAAQQKAFEAFLKVVQKTNDRYGISSYTDTIGTKKYNKALAQKRAGYVTGLLTDHHTTGAVIGIEGETAKFGPSWQNRRVDVYATLKVPYENTATETGTAPEAIAELNIENILFIPDQAVLTESSYAFVRQLAQQLQQYKTEKFQIIGHVNYPRRLPAEQLKDMYELSEKRARVVYNMLVQYGIAAERMTYLGVGNSQPVIAEPVTEAEKRKNMRVQVRILRH